jgi:hypothetical protein
MLVPLMSFGKDEARQTAGLMRERVQKEWLCQSDYAPQNEGTGMKEL